MPSACGRDNRLNQDIKRTFATVFMKIELKFDLYNVHYVLLSPCKEKSDTTLGSLIKNNWNIFQTHLAIILPIKTAVKPDTKHVSSIITPT